MLEVQKYLKDKSLKKLKDEKGINFRIHDHKVSLSYDQINSKEGCPIVSECRGLILRKSNGKNIISDSLPLGETTILAMPLRRFFNLGQPQASRIDLKSAYAYEKLDGCFPYDTKLNCWDGSTIKIGDVVNGKLSPTLIGIDKNGNLVPAKIVRRFKNGKKDNWMELEVDCNVVPEKGTGKHTNKIRVTTNHHILLNGEYKSAIEAEIGDEVVSYEDKPDEKVMKLIEASLLGDGSISYNGNASCRFEERHSKRQQLYLLWKFDWLGECGSSFKPVKTGYNKDAYQINSKSFKALKDLREKWYPKGKKKLSEDLSWLDDFSVAVWYMDDGNLAHNENQKDRAVFSTNDFEKEDCIRLGEKLKELYKTNYTVYYSKGWNIRLNSGKNNEIENFWNAIEPYIHTSMTYKLPVGHKKRAKGKRHQGKIKKVARKYKVINVKTNLNSKNLSKGKRYIIGYDIETTTNNYFAKGICVHNSLIITYYDDIKNQWHTATRSVPEANLPIDGFKDKTFRQLFEKAIQDTTRKSFDEWCSNLDANFTYCFELTSPENRIVVDYTDYRATLLMVRNNNILEEREIEPWAKLLGIPAPKKYNLTSFKKIVGFINSQNPLECEGVVVVDKDFNRVKIKNVDYLAYNRLRDLTANSPRALLQLIIDGKIDDAWPVLPEHLKDKAVELQDSFSDWVKQAQTLYENCIFVADGEAEKGTKEHRKAFALAAKNSYEKHQHFLFALYDEKAKNLEDFLMKQKSDDGTYLRSFLDGLLGVL